MNIMSIDSIPNSAVVKNNEFNWNLVNRSDIDKVIFVEDEGTDTMVVSFATEADKAKFLPEFETEH